MYYISTGEFHCFSARLYSEEDESVPFLQLALSTASPVGVAVFFCHVKPNYINTVIRGAFGGSTVLSNKQWPSWNYLPRLIHVREPLSSPFSGSLGVLKFFLLCSLGFKVNEETQAINLERWFEWGETADREWRKRECWKRCSFLCTEITLRGECAAILRWPTAQALGHLIRFWSGTPDGRALSSRSRRITNSRDNYKPTGELKYHAATDMITVRSRRKTPVYFEVALWFPPTLLLNFFFFFLPLPWVSTWGTEKCFLRIA